MAAWLFTAAAWMLVLAGVFIAWRFGWRDPGRGTRRCPKCGYDMTATSGLRCSECGHEALSEKRLRRRRMRRRWIVVGAMVALVSWFPFKWPEYQGRNGIAAGELVFVPKTILVVAWPWIVDWQYASTDNPNAWWAKRNARMHYNLKAAIAPDSLWVWQRSLLLAGVRDIFRTSSSQARFMEATRMVIEYGSPDEETRAAYLDGYLAAPPSWQLSLSPDRLMLFEVPKRYLEPLRNHLVRHPRVLRYDTSPLESLRYAKEPIDEVVLAFLASAPSDAALDRVAAMFANENLSLEAANDLFARVQATTTVKPHIVVPLIRSTEPCAANFRTAIDRAMREAEPYIRGQIVTALGLIPAGDQRIDEMLASYRCDTDADVELAADMALATRSQDTGRVRSLLRRVNDVLSESLQEANRQPPRVLWAALAESGSRSTWPMPLRLEALWMVIESMRPNENWVDCMLAVGALVRLGDAYRPEAVAYFVREFRAGNTVGQWAWDCFIYSDRVPRPMMQAARESLSSLQGGPRKRREGQIERAAAKSE